MWNWDQDWRPKILIKHQQQADMSAAVHRQVYSGSTMAEYFRDMGRNVILIADTLSDGRRLFKKFA